MSHTEGRLSVHGVVVFDESGKIVCKMDCDLSGFFDAKENARRLVACWNACDGIETEDLESAMSVSNQPLRENVMHSALIVEDNNRLITERTELVSAATKILDAVMDNASVPLELILGLKDALDKVKS